VLAELAGRVYSVEIIDELAQPQECPMRTHRFGRKIKLPATIAIKRQIIMLMALDEAKKAEAQLIEQSARRAVRTATDSSGRALS
jgi:hypothetical protein